VGIGQASMAAAARAAERFSIVTTTPALEGSIWELAASLGHAPSRLASVRTPPGGDAAALMADATAMEASLAALAREAIDADGARAIIIGGGPLARAARDLAPRFEQPIIEPLPAAVGLVAASLADGSPD
jgi:allantoin racemase